MCTAIRFTDDQGNMFFGRNLDWTLGYGQGVMRTPGDAKVPAAFARPGDPERGHDVIGVGIEVLGVPLYFDCANEAGLAVAGLNFPQSAHYAAGPAQGTVNVAAYEFPYWVARSFGSVAEARDALGGVTVVAKPVSDKLPVANLHWIVADATGAIVVECMEDGMRVWDDDVDVLTNEPNFGWHRQNLRNYLTLTDADPAGVSWGRADLRAFGSGEGLRGVPGDYSGPSRFVKVAFANAHYPTKSDEKDNVTRLFRTLGSVAVPEGCARMADGSYEKTLYTSGFSAATRTYYYATYDDPQIREFPLAG
ncbi:MAG TPA: choloylglycine hydrolase [Candidatus Olsenella excrementavium]|uniref:choloylglycine hydrolase n=1 Tax=Candidatus Olsenella excrementavium TaxID=2838709 RepID=A0A9D1ZEK3_9ACTN|nr:choloylglycine hydrolase [Candidatus Olsenella excrementavium]